MNAIDESSALHGDVLRFAQESLSGALSGRRRAHCFEELALSIARFQAKYCPGHARRFLDASSLEQLRPLPVDCFRFADVFAFDATQASVTYRTSGTTAALTGRHLMRTTSTYRKLACLGAERALLSEQQVATRAGLPRLLALIPRPGTPSTSSLGDMAHWLIERWNDPVASSGSTTPAVRSLDAPSGDVWLLDDSGVRLDALRASLDAERTDGRGVVLFATSFALVMLLDALAGRRLPLPPHSAVVYTGGFKGRSRELSAIELQAQVTEMLSPESMVGEYGMTELSSQLYQGAVPEAAVFKDSVGLAADVYLPPPWLKVRALDPATLEPIEAGQAGLAAFIDLGNIDSAVYVVTQDLIQLEGDAVRLLGRRARAPMRGCSLAAEAIWSAQVGPQPFAEITSRSSDPLPPNLKHETATEPVQSVSPRIANAAALGRVRRLVAAARELVEDDGPGATELRSGLMAATGLSAEGIELGLRTSVEIQPRESDLNALCASVEPAERVWVVLSANVFVAAHRAVACALAASPNVIVRPSQRDPVLVRALHAATGDLFQLTTELAPGPGDHVHAYGSDETMEVLAQQLPDGVTLKAHGSGFGAVLVFEAVDVVRLANSIALDTILFDQRGCASPRLCVLGPAVDASVLAAELRRALGEWGERVPRVGLSPPEIDDQVWFEATAAFVAREDVEPGKTEGVYLQDTSRTPLIPPGARSLVLVRSDDPLETLAALSASLTCIAVSGRPEQWSAVARALPFARLCAPGTMQRPPLDGPLDRRPQSTFDGQSCSGAST